jgi:hypothetical protein
MPITIAVGPAPSRFQTACSGGSIGIGGRAYMASSVGILNCTVNQKYVHGMLKLALVRN